MDNRAPSNLTTLRREVGLGGAIFLGLGSILGTGVFVSIGVAAGVVGPGVVVAIALAALVATANGLSSAQLAAAYPVSGGTYEYGHRVLNPSLGFAAGWLFLCAKSASAATAALGFSGYALHATGTSQDYLVPLAFGTALAVTWVVQRGTRRSNRANAVLVCVVLGTLLAFVIGALPHAGHGVQQVSDWVGEIRWGNAGALLHATALLFVAYTGYGRVATLGEEVKDPAHTIPKAILATLLVSMIVYVSVAVAALGVLGGDGLADATARTAAPLEVAARALGGTGLQWAIVLGAMAAMLGVLLNLILGLSRVQLAMGRRGDLPARLAHVDASGLTPTAAVWTTGGIVAALTLLGSVRIAWSFSAFTVLVYYALTNAAALRLAPEHRRYPRWIAGMGFVACLFLAFWVEVRIWAVGLGVIAAGFLLRAFLHQNREKCQVKSGGGGGN